MPEFCPFVFKFKHMNVMVEIQRERLPDPVCCVYFKISDVEISFGLLNNREMEHLSLQTLFNKIFQPKSMLFC